MRSTRQTIIIATILVVIGLTTVGVWAVRSSSRNSQVEFEAGWTALKQQRWRQVSLQIEKLRKQSADRDYVRVLRAGLMVDTGDPRTGLELLQPIPQQDDLREHALLVRCAALYKLKRFLDAFEVAKEVLESPRHGNEAHRWLAAIYFDLGAMEHAESELRTLASLEPQDFSPYRLLGLIHLDFERYKEAIDDFQQAIHRNPPDSVLPELRLGLAKAFARQNDFEAALKVLDSPSLASDAESLALLAECLWMVGQKDAGRRRLEQAQVLGPQDLNVLWLRARWELDDDRTAEAIATLSTIVKRDIGYDQALLALSSAHRRLGNNQLAEKYLAERNAVRQLFERMVELNARVIREPNDASVRDELASVCEKLGKPELAAIWRDAAQSLRSTTQMP